MSERYNRRYNLDTKKHRGTRSVLRVIGPIVLITGIALTVIGFGGFLLGALGVMDDPPGIGEGIPPKIKLFVLAFIGMPLMFVGTVLTKMGYMGSIARYIASEAAPVAKDTTNYMLDGTKHSIGSLAQSVGAGIAAGLSGQKPASEQTPCPGCGKACDSGARYCDQCGTPIPGEVRCESCGNLNDPAARFCDQCGTKTGV